MKSAFVRNCLHTVMTEPSLSQLYTCGITSYAAGGTGRRSRSPLGTRACLVPPVVPLGDKIGCVCRFISFTSFMKPRREPVRVPSFLRVPARVALENTLLEHCQQYLRTVSDRAPLGESVISQW